VTDNKKTTSKSNKDKILDCIIEVYEYCKKSGESFSRDNYRKLSKDLDIEVASDSPAREEFGTWTVAVSKALAKQLTDSAKIDNGVLVDTEIYNLPHHDESGYSTIRHREVRNKLHKVFVFPDIHFPFQSNSALRCAVKAMITYEPDEVVLLGDLLDFYKVSKYLKDPKRGVQMQYELDMAKAFLQKLRNLLPGVRIIYLSGNHEDRLEKYLLGQAPALSGLDCLQLSALLDLDEMDIHFIPSHNFYSINKVHFTHGEYANTYSSKKHLDVYGATIIHGHTHRIQMHMTRYLDRTIEGWEIGFLASHNVSADYMKMGNWQHGFGTVEIFNDDYWVHPHHIRDSKLVFQGHLIDGSIEGAND